MYIRHILIWSCSLCSIVSAHAVEEKAIFDLKKSFDASAIETQDANFEIIENAIIVNTAHNERWPGIRIKALEGHWDLSDFQYLTFDIRNTGNEFLRVNWRIDNPGADGIKNCITRSIELSPGEKKPFKVVLPRKLPEHIGKKLFGMRGYPGGLLKDSPLDVRNINQFVIFVADPKVDHSFEIGSIYAGGAYVTPRWISMSESEFFPFIDEYGQFIHKDWKGKTKSNEDLQRCIREEQIDIEKNPSPENWNKYGGYNEGPKFEATGFFRTEKYNGKWWLIDPEGRLFWSHGIDCVGDWNGVTPITDREFYFKWLPDRNSLFGKFYGESSWAPHNYYEGKGTYVTYNFTGSNLLRKYGESWRERFAEISHKRLRSWGMNTIANWSSDYIYLMRKTPYVVSINFGGKLLEGSEGYWGKFRDVFDDSFEQEVKKSMAWQKGRTANDPWCIGYFVDNEISWGDEVSLSIAALMSPPDQPAKKVFVSDLKEKYQSIENLNKVWGTEYTSWDNMLESKIAPNRDKAYEDLTAFYTKTAERYFKVCRDAVKEVAPNNLYLGCRFAWTNDLAVIASSKYCDVISYNFYLRSVENIKLPAGIDRPIIIGEFHFGALDRGMFHTGLQETEDQEDRARAYKNYVNGALRNPYIVGTHWFQYGDQATTGRGDGENYQIGFLDIADTPYEETIRACREVGYNMYKLRLENK